MYIMNTAAVAPLADEATFAGIVGPLEGRVPAPRCADGNGTLTHLFFSDAPLDIARAKAVCARCDLAATCLAGALERHEPWGVWGGELVEMGRVVVNKRHRGRPPRQTRPELVVDEVPIPPHIRPLDRPFHLPRPA